MGWDGGGGVDGEVSKNNNSPPCPELWRRASGL